MSSTTSISNLPLAQDTETHGFWVVSHLEQFSLSPSSPIIFSHVAALGSRHGMASLPKSQTLYPYTRLLPLCLDCSASLSSWRISTHLSSLKGIFEAPPDCGLFTSASLLTYLPNTEVLCVLVTLLGSTPCDPMDYNPPGSSVHGILQARILEWVATPFSRGSSQHRLEPTSLMSPALAGRFFTTSASWDFIHIHFPRCYAEHASKMKPASDHYQQPQPSFSEDLLSAWPRYFNSCSQLILLSAKHWYPRYQYKH